MESSALFLDLFNNIDVLLVVLVRLTGFFMMLPLFSGSSIPVTFRIMFIVPLAYIIYSSGVVTNVSYYDSIFGLGLLLIKEFFTGFSMSFAVYIIFTIMYMAGQFIDYQIGFSMVSVLDPVSQIQVPITGNLLNILMLLILIRSGGFHVFVATIYRSFDVLPIGQAVILNNSTVPWLIINLITEYFSLGVQLAVPIMGTIMIVDISMGFLVKAAPQMNVFVVGMPIKLLVGLVVLYAVVPAFGGIYEFIYEQAMEALLNVMGGLLP